MSFQQENKWKRERIGRAVANDSFTIPYNVGWNTREEAFSNLRKYVSLYVTANVEAETLRKILVACQTTNLSVYDKINDYDFTPSKR